MWEFNHLQKIKTVFFQIFFSQLSNLDYDLSLLLLKKTKFERKTKDLLKIKNIKFRTDVKSGISLFENDSGINDIGEWFHGWTIWQCLKFVAAFFAFLIFTSFLRSMVVPMLLQLMLLQMKLLWQALHLL